MFVVLSGPSCVGKTTSSKLLLAKLETPCILIEADNYLPRFNAAAEVTLSDNSKQITLALHRAIAEWSDLYRTVLIDGSLPFESADLIRPCLDILGPDTRTVALTCELGELERRLSLRSRTGDLSRVMRQQRTLPDLVPADLTVDSTDLTPAAVADVIADWLLR